MELKQKIEADLKKALLSGDKEKATLLRGLKSTILNAEIAQGARDSGLDDDKIVELFKKEAKSRQESADLYKQGGSEERANKELSEKVIIEEYLPAQLSDEELQKMVDEAIANVGQSGPQAMGQVIGQVKQKAGVAADGSRIAAIAKERLQQ